MKKEGFHGALATNPMETLIMFMLPWKHECHIGGQQLHRFVK
jgi:hypothetical protein